VNKAYDDHMANLYGWLCLRPNIEAAVAALEAYALRDLYAWLEQQNPRTGIPAMISGLLFCEAADRFMRETQDIKTQAASEDGGGE